MFKKKLIIFRFDLNLSHTIKIRIINLNMEISDPIDEIIFQNKKVSG